MKTLNTCSSVDVAVWFIDRAFEDNVRLQPSKLQILLYISQGVFSAVYKGKMLMPCYFTVTETCPIEPNSWRLLPICDLDNYTIALSPSITYFLDRIYAKYSHLSMDKLLDIIDYKSIYDRALKPSQNNQKNLSLNAKPIKTIKKTKAIIIEHKEIYHFFANLNKTKKIKKEPYQKNSVKMIAPKMKILPDGKKIKQWNPPVAKSLPINGLEYGKDNNGDGKSNDTHNSTH